MADNKTRVKMDSQKAIVWIFPLDYSAGDEYDTCLLLQAGSCSAEWDFAQSCPIQYFMYC